MTFFDRKVDLAQFPPNHPLYVMCRAWMRNDPSGSEEPVQPTSPQACSYAYISVYDVRTYAFAYIYTYVVVTCAQILSFSYSPVLM